MMSNAIQEDDWNLIMEAVKAENVEKDDMSL